MYEFPREIIISQDIILRRWRNEDVSTLFALIDKNRNYLRRWLLWVDQVKTVADSRKYIKKCIANYTRQQESLDLGIWYKGELVGAIGFNEIDSMHSKASIGYWLSEDFSGKGIITSAVKRLVDLAFEVLHIKRIIILCDTQNKRSCAVPERLGFTLEGVIRKDEKRHGNFYDYNVFALLREDQKIVINTNDVFVLTKQFASFIRRNKKKIIDVLTLYENYAVAVDEIDRTLDLLENLSENGNYFVKKTKKIISFLPINQPLYALTCFAIIPSLMAEEVFVRPPNVSWEMMNHLIRVLRLNEYFPNVFISNQQRNAFIEEHTSSHTDAVIFTGSSKNALMTQERFGDDVLFIGNGSSHNPVVVSKGADLKRAVEGIVEVQLYNQGGDCAAPNAVLVEDIIFDDFLDELHSALRKIKTGAYKSRQTTVGPFLERKHFISTLDFLEEMKEYLDPETPGIAHDDQNLLEPTIILKPLHTGGNYKELFAPVFFIQKYRNDTELEKYFDNDQYREHAAYITLYGHSDYINSLVSNRRTGSTSHKEDSIIRNTHLHAVGVERGTKPYGGYGTYSSFISYKGKTISKPTLPQRDIFEYLIAYKGHTLQEIKDEIIQKAKVVFGDDLHFVSLAGSVIYGGSVLGKSDLDIVLLLNDNFLINNTKEQLHEKCMKFAEHYIYIHKKYGFSPDLLFPGEFLTLGMVDDVIAGRGFAVKDNRLHLPPASGSYYLGSEETWFRAWLSMLAFSKRLQGSSVEFRKIQKRAWKTIILFLLSKHDGLHIAPTDITQSLIKNTNKALGFGVTDNYFLFEALELLIIKDVFKMLCKEGFLTKKKQIYFLNKDKILDWEKRLVQKISNKTIRNAELILNIDDVKGISDEAKKIFRGF